MASRRRNARIIVMQTLFELDFPGRRGKEETNAILERNFADFDESIDMDFAHALLDGILENQEYLLSVIQKHAPQWPLERMETIARSLLTIGAYELLCANDAPPAVVMDEAIEIAKSFAEDESGKFVNGVLNAIASKERSPAQ